MHTTDALNYGRLVYVRSLKLNAQNHTFLINIIAYNTDDIAYYKIFHNHLIHAELH